MLFKSLAALLLFFKVLVRCEGRRLQHSPVVACIMAESLFHSFWDMSQFGRCLSSPCRTDLSVAQRIVLQLLSLPVCVRVVRRRTEYLKTSRLKACPAGARCEPEPCGPSWPRAGRPRLGSSASGWGRSPAVGAAPDVSVADPPSRSHW